MNLPKISLLFGSPQIPRSQAAQDRGIKRPQLDVASPRHGPHNRQAIFPSCQHPGFVGKNLSQTMGDTPSQVAGIPIQTWP